MASERDIDYVVVSGAGASCSFGVNGTRLPLMGDWADGLVRKLAEGASMYLTAVELHNGLEPVEFEKRLGAFLRRVTAFSEIEPLVTASRHFQVSEPASLVSAEGVLEGWHRSTAHHLSQIVDLIHESLYEQFAEPRVDIARAVSAYRELFEALGVGPASSWVYATTNYDTIGETVIELLGMNPDWGEPPQASQSGERTIRVDGLVEGIPRYVPVLHLHGRVGWYRRMDLGSSPAVYSAPVTRHQPAFGAPIVMLPDPAKAYDSDVVINALWTEFTAALRRANRVFVLGHSLNDGGLVQALRENVQPLERIAVTVLSDLSDPSAPDSTAKSVVETIQSQLGNATVIPLRFGTDVTFEKGEINAWLAMAFA